MNPNSQNNPQLNFKNSSNNNNNTYGPKYQNNQKNKSKQKSNIFNSKSNNNNKPEFSNVNELKKFFKEGNLTKKDLTHFSILSPKTQKEILSNQANLMMMNENLFQKKIDFNLNEINKEEYICKIFNFLLFLTFFLS